MVQRWGAIRPGATKQPATGLLLELLRAWVRVRIVIITTLDLLMDEMISAAEANRAFSRILRDVQAGRAYVVTVHGRAVARIAPLSGEDAARAVARDLLLTRLRAQPAQEAGPWRRDDLYDDKV